MTAMAPVTSGRGRGPATLSLRLVEARKNGNRILGLGKTILNLDVLIQMASQRASLRGNLTSHRLQTGECTSALVRTPWKLGLQRPTTGMASRWTNLKRGDVIHRWLNRGWPRAVAPALVTQGHAIKAWVSKLCWHVP